MMAVLAAELNPLSRRRRQPGPQVPQVVESQRRGIGAPRHRLGQRQAYAGPQGDREGGMIVHEGADGASEARLRSRLDLQLAVAGRALHVVDCGHPVAAAMLGVTAGARRREDLRRLVDLPLLALLGVTV